MAVHPTLKAVHLAHAAVHRAQAAVHPAQLAIDMQGAVLEGTARHQGHFGHQAGRRLGETRSPARPRRRQGPEDAEGLATPKRRVRGYAMAVLMLISHILLPLAGGDASPPSASEALQLYHLFMPNSELKRALAAFSNHRFSKANPIC